MILLKSDDLVYRHAGIMSNIDSRLDHFPNTVHTYSKILKAGTATGMDTRGKSMT